VVRRISDLAVASLGARRTPWWSLMYQSRDVLLRALVSSVDGLERCRRLERRCRLFISGLDVALRWRDLLLER
jgi:hypothetical protein